MTENVDVMYFYRKNYDDISNEIISGIKEGIEEGVEEGVKEGFFDGLTECLGEGFLKIRETEIKSLEKILEDEVVDTIKNEVESGVKKEICPILNDRLDFLCGEVLNKIKEKKITVRSDILDLAKEFDTGELAGTKIDEIMQNMKSHLPQNFFLGALYDGFQKGISECLTENISKCDNKIKDAILRNSSS